MSEEDNIGGRTPVDRQRRFWFVSRLVAFCLIVSALIVIVASFGYVDASSTLIEIYVKSLMSLATAIGLAYIGGSVVDYNGGFGNMFTKASAPSQQYPQYGNMYETSYPTQGARGEFSNPYTTPMHYGMNDEEDKRTAIG